MGHVESEMRQTDPKERVLQVFLASQQHPNPTFIEHSPQVLNVSQLLLVYVGEGVAIEHCV